jgi:hypothetical protein
VRDGAARDRRHDEERDHEARPTFDRFVIATPPPAARRGRRRPRARSWDPGRIASYAAVRSDAKHHIFPQEPLEVPASAGKPSVARPSTGAGRLASLRRARADRGVRRRADRARSRDRDTREAGFRGRVRFGAAR